MGADPAPHIIRNELTSGGSIEKFTALTSVNPAAREEPTRRERRYDFAVEHVSFCSKISSMLLVSELSGT
jgi:hypothetical protein